MMQRRDGYAGRGMFFTGSSVSSGGDETAGDVPGTDGGQRKISQGSQVCGDDGRRNLRNTKRRVAPAAGNMYVLMTMW